MVGQKENKRIGHLPSSEDGSVLRTHIYNVRTGIPPLHFALPYQVLLYHRSLRLLTVDC